MKITQVVKEQAAMELNESKSQRDTRIEQLWEKLDPQRKGELDLKGLQKGLRRIDHRQLDHNIEPGTGRLLMRSQL